MSLRPLFSRSRCLSSAVLAGSAAFLLAGIPVALGGNPLETEPTMIPEEAYQMPDPPSSRNPKNRFGVQGGVAFGVKAEFVSEAFIGNDITAVPANGPEDVIVDSARGSADEDGGFGGEIFYERVLGESDLVYDGVNETWGFHIGVGFTQVELRDGNTVNGFRALDPGAPPGSEPKFLNQGTMIHDLEADIWNINIGLFKESYLTDRFYAKVGGGLSVAYIEGQYGVTGPFDFADEYVEEEDILIGGYLDLTLGYDFNRYWGIYGGIRYQYLTSFEIETPSSSAELEFDQSFMAFLGLRFSF